MESKNTASFILLLSLSLLCFSQVSATSPTPNTPVYTTSTYHPKSRCDGLKLGVCVNVLNLVDIVAGSPLTMPCCSLLLGLVDLEAAICLCTAMRANILGVHLNVHVSHNMVFNNCGRNVPTGFECHSIGPS